MVYREQTEVGPYLAALTAAAIDAVTASPDGPPRLQEFQGLVLTGGPDVDPALYGEVRQAQTEEPDPERDAVENELLAQALRRDMPVLAICRGLQLLNVFHGGDLIQHLEMAERHQKEEGDHATPAHCVLITPDSLLFSIAEAREWRVNSRHHQAARRLGSGLVVSAIDPEDGTIEALERPDKRFVLGVQWHPENQALVDAGQLRIFQRFGKAVRRPA